MGPHMKTTVEISDALLQEARKLAARDGLTLRQLVEQGLQQVLEERNRPATFKLRDASFEGTGLSKEAEQLSWDEIRALAYTGRGT